MAWPQHRHAEPESALAGYLEYASRLLADLPAAAPAFVPVPLAADADFEHLRWFSLPHEIAELGRASQPAA
jgi:hypothetical protein